MVNVVPYSNSLRDDWNRFLRCSKNGTFLFERDYLAYHADLFADSSLLFYQGERLCGLLPASRDGKTIVSHGGLTFGGVVSNGEMRIRTMMDIFEAFIEFARREGCSSIIYKAVPHIYHRLPAEEDLYALFRCNAQLIRRDASTSIFMSDRLSCTALRTRWASKAAKLRVEVGRSDDFREFMRITSESLAEKYKLKPVHSVEEIRSLAGRFPYNIKLYTASHCGMMLGGVIIYESNQVAHAQYIAATQRGKQMGALDAVFSLLLDQEFKEKAYFDFGISTEQGGRWLNEGLISNKESYGGRTIAYDFYKLSL